jgi:hypothetical protein
MQPNLEGKPAIAVKTFGKNSFKLCNREQMPIVKAEHNNPKNLINSRSELHGACRHLPRFQRLSLKTKLSADERMKREKIDLESPTRMTRRKPIPSILTLNLEGNEFESLHSPAEKDSSEFLLI